MDLRGRCGLLDLPQIACPDDGDIHDGVGQRLRDGHLCHRDACYAATPLSRSTTAKFCANLAPWNSGLLLRQSSLKKVVCEGATTPALLILLPQVAPSQRVSEETGAQGGIVRHDQQSCHVERINHVRATCQRRFGSV